MDSSNSLFSVFTKPWKTLSIDELGKLISGMGFCGIEFPVRDGYQVVPESAEKGLPLLAKQLGEYGLKITSVASNLNEQVFAGCAAAGIPMIRTMATASLKNGYFASMEKKEKEIESILPLCEKYGVKVGIQQHCGAGINNSMELLNFLEKFDPQYIGGIWDAAHSGLAGEEPEQGLEILWSRLFMVNLKNAFYKLVSGPEAETALWKRYFTLGRRGLSSWVRVSDYLKKKEYKGVVCLCAEYTDEEQVNRLITDDFSYVKYLFA
ncbi:MAG TPA: xylose isomerase [Clostridiales bacterium]|nr:xylose isomerase [Clostridiales bacterium]